MADENNKAEEQEMQAEEKAAQTETSAESDATGSENADSAAENTAESTEQTCESEEPKELTPEEKIAELEKENAELKDQLLRRAADFENYRKRMIKEKQDAFDYGNAALFADLLDSLDNFDRTVAAAETATDPKSIADGIKMINSSLVNMLENKYNLTSYGAEGDEFDPELHEAIGMQEAEVEKEQLAAVYLKGYKLKDRVIRHAKVMVAKPKA
ncbi:MAG: nucleotide exchange factor GrpE [Treponema sp.]|nr:nucleotide exchange factor GrpE [Treponema sp.]